MMGAPEPSNFATRWHGLPSELKLHILSYIIPVGRVYRAISFSKRLDRKLFLKAHGCDLDFDALVFPLLTCPGIAALVKEIFYGQNIMLIRNIPVGRYLRYPPRTVNGFVKHVNIVLDYKTRSLDFLRKLAGGELGMQGLRDVTIHLNTRNQWGAEDSESLAQAVANLPYLKIRAHRLQLRMCYDYVEPHTDAHVEAARTKAQMYRELFGKMGIYGPAKETSGEEKQFEIEGEETTEWVILTKSCVRCE
ncbi:hypothetical protein ACN47E_001775 [Coniothyrium glycines]